MSPVVLLAAIENWPTLWLTPVWLLSVGVLGGLAILLLLWLGFWLVSRLPGLGELADGFAVVGHDAGLGAVLGKYLIRPWAVFVSRRTVDEVHLAIREGVLKWLFVVAVGLAAFSFLGVVFVDAPRSLLASLTRLPYTGSTTLQLDVPVSLPEDPQDRFSDLVAHSFEISYRTDEIREIRIRSPQNLSMSTRPFLEVKPGEAIEVDANEEVAWFRGFREMDERGPETVDRLYIRNLGSEPAQVQLTLVTAPPHPEVATVPLTAISVALVFLLYLWQRAVAPRLSAIALATYKSEVNQPLFTIFVVLGVVLLWMFIWIPYNTFGEDIKMLKNAALPLIVVLGLLQAVWAASTSVADEIDGRTALTVLSKPIGRRSFIFGKFIGILWTVGLLFVLLGLVLLLVVAYKPIVDTAESAYRSSYDPRDVTVQNLSWEMCHQEMVYTVPGLVLAFLQTVVLTAIGVAISTRLPWLANLVICLVVYALGNLAPLIVQSSMGQNSIVRFFGQLIATVFPNLGHFNIQAAVAAGAAVPYVYLAGALVYCLLFSGVAMLLALALFEDRDLA